MSLELKSNGHQNNLKEAKAPDTNVYEFEEFVLDASHLMLCRRGGEELSTTPKQVETLLALVERRGEIVAIDVLMNRLWPNAFVEESNLIQNIHILRKTLGETADGKPMIETLRRRGYRFNGELKTRAHAQHEIVPRVSPQEETPQILKFPSAVSSSQPISEKVVTRTSVGKNRTIAAFGVFILIAAAIAAGYFLYPAETIAGDGKKEFAIMPVMPMDPANRSDIYQIGIADALIQQLSSVKGFIIRPLSATRGYTDIDQDPLAAGREQKVDYVLTSNYQIADGKIRITSQLYNVQSGLVDGSFKVEHDNSTIFAVQDAVAANIGQSLLKKLANDSNDHLEKRHTTSEEAYRLFIQGMALADKRKDVSKAIEYFEQAVRLDPNYALAYAELGSAHSYFAFNGDGRNATDGYLKGKAAIEKALAIDETLAEAHSYLGILKSNYEWDFAGAEHEHKRAVELNPNSSTAHCFYGLLLGTIGKSDEAIVEMKTAIDLEPASAATRHSYGWVLFQSRRYDEAIAEEERVVEMDPQLIMANNVLMNSYDKKGDDDRSFEYFVRLQTLRKKEPGEISLLQTIYAQSGWRGVSERQFEQAKEEERKGRPHYAHLAGLSIDLGQYEQAIDYLEKAVDQNKFTLITLKVNPRYDELRSNPRFDDLVRRVGLK